MQSMHLPSSLVLMVMAVILLIFKALSWNTLYCDIIEHISNYFRSYFGSQGISSQLSLSKLGVTLLNSFKFSFSDISPTSGYWSENSLSL